MFCGNCGTSLDENMAFCPECGTKVAVVETEETSADSAAPVAEETVATPATTATEETVATPVAPSAEETITTPVAPIPSMDTTSQDTKKKSKAPIIVIVVLLLLFIALGLAIWYVLSNGDKNDKPDNKESTEVFAGEEENDEDDSEPTPKPTEEPTPEPTEVPTPEPTEKPTPKPTVAPTPEPTEDPEVEPTEAPETEPTDDPEVEPTEAPESETTDDPDAEPTEAPEAEPTDDPEAEPTEAPIVWNDPVFDIDTSAYEKYSTYECEMEIMDMTITDTQTIFANGDLVSAFWESTKIDFTGLSEDEIAFYAEYYDETYKPYKENAPDYVDVVYGLDGNGYRFELIVYLEGADLKELADGGYISLTSGSIDTVKFISYEQTCEGLEAGGYTLVE